MLAESSVSCNSSDRSASDMRTVEHEADPLGSACVAQSGKHHACVAESCLLCAVSVSCSCSSRMPLSWLATAWLASAAALPQLAIYRVVGLAPVGTALRVAAHSQTN